MASATSQAAVPAAMMAVSFPSRGGGTGRLSLGMPARLTQAGAAITRQAFSWPPILAGSRLWAYRVRARAIAERLATGCSPLTD